MTEPTLIPISIHSDERGELRYCNEFDLSTAKRFYSISFVEKNQVRAWQAHKIENKAMMPIRGISKIVLVKLSDFAKGIAEDTFEYTLNASYPTILFVPEGYANGLQSKSPDSSLMIFSNLSIEEAKNDDFRFEASRFYTW